MNPKENLKELGLKLPDTGGTQNFDQSLSKSLTGLNGRDIT